MLQILFFLLVFSAFNIEFAYSQDSCNQPSLDKIVCKQENSQQQQQQLTMTRIPPLFISHGSPSLYLEKGTSAYSFLSNLGKELKKYPIKAIVCVSAHWENSVINVNTSPNPEQIYDFYGFPDEMYKFKYTPEGLPEVAQRVVELLKQQGIPHKENPSHGLDHGVWSPLSIVFPDAHVPIVQVSLNRNLDPVTHFNLGRALAPLQDEGILLVASGGIVHNLGAISFSKGESKGPDWANTFLKNISKIICENSGKERQDMAVEMYKSDSVLPLAHPRTEHLVPIWVACGFSYNTKAKEIHSSMVYGSLAMNSFSF